MTAECQVQINAKPMRESGRNWHERNRQKKGKNYQRLSLGFVTVLPVLVSMLVLKFEQGTAFVETGRIISASPGQRQLASQKSPQLALHALLGRQSGLARISSWVGPHRLHSARDVQGSIRKHSGAI
jgi:hypothetical protein